jgi:HAD superfamily hydrolase (TIGR01509 family)
MRYKIPMDWTQRTHWIFDMDGTLTVPAHDFAKARTFLGIGEEEDILTAIAQRPADVREKDLAWLEAWEAEVVERSQPQRDAQALLEALRKRGCHLGVLTRNTRAAAFRTLQVCNFLEFFEPSVILGREDAVPKPHPAGIQMLLEQWGATPDQAVMVGDYVHDSRAGQAAGVLTILVDREGSQNWAGEADFLVQGLYPLPK